MHHDHSFRGALKRQPPHTLPGRIFLNEWGRPWPPHSYTVGFKDTALTAVGIFLNAHRNPSELDKMLCFRGNLGLYGI